MILVFGAVLFGVRDSARGIVDGRFLVVDARSAEQSRELATRAALTHQLRLARAEW